MTEAKPTLTIIAGPNGSGKSTFDNQGGTGRVVDPALEMDGNPLQRKAEARSTRGMWVDEDKS